MQEENLPCLPYLSEENRRAHLAYRNTLAARLSLFKKCFPRWGERESVELLTAHLSLGEEEGRALAAELFLHDIAFSSCAVPRREAPRERLLPYSSDAALRYAMREEARHAVDGFLCIETDRHGRVRLLLLRAPWKGLIRLPLLAVDLAEHAYFYDYGFARDRYLAAAVDALDLSRLGRTEA